MLKEIELGFLCFMDYISYFIAGLWFVELDLRINCKIIFSEVILKSYSYLANKIVPMS